jgi:hypothetical protein
LEIINAKGHLPHLSAAEEIADALRRHLPRLSGSLRGRSQR